MAVHKSKGLEFPVVILGSLKDGKFPMKYKEKSEDKRSIFNMDYTPNEFLEYKKNLSVDGEELEYIKEEKRVIYVVMTCAESILILSAIEELPDVFNSMNIDIDSLNSFNKLPYLKLKDKVDLDDSIDLSYTSINNYNGYPFKYI